jgi:putative ABC transport system permease protein
VGSTTYATTLTALPANTTMHGFLDAGGGSLRLGDGIILGVSARTLLGVAAGGDVTVAVPGAPPVTAAVTGFVDEPLGTLAYVSLDWLARQDPTPPNSALVRFAPGVDRTAMRTAITALSGVAAYQDSQALQAVFRQYAGLFYGFVGAMLVLGATAAFAIIFTTMSANIAERAREVATLRASGVRMRTIAQLISTENLIVTVLGIVPGLILGVIGGRLMLDSFSSDMFRLEMAVRPFTLLMSAGAIVAVAVLSQWPGLRSVRRLDIATVVREQVS